MSFSAFHSQKKKKGACPFQITISFITIYRITEFFDSPAIVRHSMELTKGLTYHLNLSQKQVVITRDQPVFAPGKKVKWMYLVIWIWKHVFERARITTTGQLKVSCTVYRVQSLLVDVNIYDYCYHCNYYLIELFFILYFIFFI